MKLQTEVALGCLICLIWFQNICGADELSSEINKWKCTCSSAFQGNQTYIIENCSTSCNCSPDGSIENRWTCTCAADGFPKVSAYNQITSCFTACNCSFGLSSVAQSSKKYMHGKVVVIILLLCIVLTALAFIASLTCYFYRREKCSSVQPPLFSSEKEISCNSNSTTNLISSHRACSISGSKICIGSPINPITGCILKTSFLFRSRTETSHGTLTRFSYSELETITKKFSNSNLIGIGSSSHVYRGHLKDGRIVAVKRLKPQGGPDSEAVFLTEIDLLSRLHHYHVVPLLGYCSVNIGKHVERLLVFEFMSNGNLRDSLDGGASSGKCLDWSTRVAIALGAARGLEYLHEAAAPRILHRDVKSSNILLDENWRAKITDLGLAKHLRTDGIPSCSSSPARMQGTFGYFAPEYAIVGRASLKSDVFSFGVVLLELITGRHAINRSGDKGEESLVIWATPRLHNSRKVIMELPDPRLKGIFPEEDMQIMAYLAKECLLLDPESRPTMSEVVQILSTIAPDKSKRRKYPPNIFQHGFPPGITDRDGPDKADDEDDDIVEGEVLKQVVTDKWSDRSSLPLSVERTLCLGKKSMDRGKNSVSAEEIDIDIERLILLTKNGRSWHSQDDETVDLTEPRFESFSMASVVQPPPS